MPRPVTLDERVAAYRPLCNSLARRFAGGFGGAEVDDLEQEGLIQVWLLLDRGLPVSKTAVKNRMRDWVRYCRRRGFSYEERSPEE